MAMPVAGSRRHHPGQVRRKWPVIPMFWTGVSGNRPKAVISAGKRWRARVAMPLSSCQSPTLMAFPTEDRHRSTTFIALLQDLDADHPPKGNVRVALDDQPARLEGDPGFLGESIRAY